LKKKHLIDSFEDEDALDLEDDGDELFSTGAGASSGAQSPFTPIHATVSSAADPLEQFVSARDHLARYLGKTPTSKDRPKRIALIPLIELAQNMSHLNDVVDAVAGWRQARRTLDVRVADAIIARCIELGHPEIALSLLANRPKFGMELPSLSNARSLLHALSKRSAEAASVETDVDLDASVAASPFHDVLLLAALYPRYKLPEIYDDPISSAIVLSFLRSSTLDEARGLESELKEVIQSSRSQRSAISVGASPEEREWAEEGLNLLPYPITFI
jgi:hypothetical protein